MYVTQNGTSQLKNTERNNLRNKVKTEWNVRWKEQAAITRGNKEYKDENILLIIKINNSLHPRVTITKASDW